MTKPKKICCRNCKFFDPVEDEDFNIGDCHRYPPTYVDDQKGGMPGFDALEWMFPTVTIGDWCGEFQKKWSNPN